MSTNFVPSPVSSPPHSVFNLVLPVLLRLDIVITSWKENWTQLVPDTFRIELRSVCPQGPCKWIPAWIRLPCCKACLHPHLPYCPVICAFFHLRDSRQDLQSVQWVHEWKGAADCLQHADGGLSLHAVPSPAPLQLSLWEVRGLRLEERGWTGAQVCTYECEWRGTFFLLSLDLTGPYSL